MLTVGGSAHPEFTDFMYGEEFYYDSNTPQETETFLQRLSCRMVIGEYMNLPDGEEIRADTQLSRKNLVDSHRRLICPVTKCLLIKIL